MGSPRCMDSSWIKVDFSPGIGDPDSAWQDTGSWASLWVPSLVPERSKVEGATPKCTFFHLSQWLVLDENWLKHCGDADTHSPALHTRDGTVQTQTSHVRAQKHHQGQSTSAYCAYVISKSTWFAINLFNLSTCLLALIFIFLYRPFHALAPLILPEDLVAVRGAKGGWARERQ